MMTLLLNKENKYLIKDLAGITEKSLMTYGKLSSLLEQLEIYFDEVSIADNTVSVTFDGYGVVPFIQFEEKTGGGLALAFLQPAVSLGEFMGKSVLHTIAAGDELIGSLYEGRFNAYSEALASYPERDYQTMLISELAGLASYYVKTDYNAALLREYRFLENLNKLTGIYCVYTDITFIVPPESTRKLVLALYSGPPVTITDYEILIEHMELFFSRKSEQEFKDFKISVLKSIYMQAKDYINRALQNEWQGKDVSQEKQRLQDWLEDFKAENVRMNGVSTSANGLKDWDFAEINAIISRFDTFAQNLIDNAANFSKDEINQAYAAFQKENIELIHERYQKNFTEFHPYAQNANIFIADTATAGYFPVEPVAVAEAGLSATAGDRIFNNYDTISTDFNGEIYFDNHGQAVYGGKEAETLARKVFTLFEKAGALNQLSKLKALYFRSCNTHPEFAGLVALALMKQIEHYNNQQGNTPIAMPQEPVSGYTFAFSLLSTSGATPPEVLKRLSKTMIGVETIVELPEGVDSYVDSFLRRVYAKNNSAGDVADAINKLKWKTPLAFDPHSAELKDFLIKNKVLTETKVSVADTALAGYAQQKMNYDKLTLRLRRAAKNLEGFLPFLAPVQLIDPNGKMVNYGKLPFERYVESVENLSRKLKDIEANNALTADNKFHAALNEIENNVRLCSGSVFIESEVNRIIERTKFLHKNNESYKKQLYGRLISKCVTFSNADYQAFFGIDRDKVLKGLFNDSFNINQYPKPTEAYLRSEASLPVSLSQRLSSIQLNLPSCVRLAEDFPSGIAFAGDTPEFTGDIENFKAEMIRYLAGESDPNLRQKGYNYLNNLEDFREKQLDKQSFEQFDKNFSQRLYGLVSHLSEALNYYGVIVSFAEGQYTFDYSIEDFEDVVVFLNTIGLYESLGQITLDVIGFFRMRYLKSISQLAKAERFAQMLAEVDQALAPFDLIITYASILEDITNINKHDENEAFYAAFLIIDTINLTMTLNAIGGGAFGGPLAVVGLAANLTGLILGSFMSIAHIKYASTAQKIDWSIGALFGSNRGEDAAYNDELRQQLEEAAQNTLKKSQYRRIIQPVSCLHYMGYNFNDNEHFPYLDNLNTPACLITFPPFDWDNIKDLDNAQIYKTPRWEIDPDSCMKAEKKPEYLFFNPILYMARSDEEGRSGTAIFLPRGMKQQHIDLSAADDDVTFLINYLPSAVMISTRDSINNKTFTHWPTEYYDAIIPVYLAENHSNIFIIQDDCDTELYKAFMDFDGSGASCGYDTRNHRYLPTSYALYPGQNSPAVLDFSNVSALDENTIDIDLAPPINSLPGLNSFYRIIDMKNTGAHLQLWLIADEETLDFTFVNRVALPQQASCHLHTGDIFITSGGFSQVYASSSAAGSLVFQPGFDDTLFISESEQTNSSIAVLL